MVVANPARSLYSERRRRALRALCVSAFSSLGICPFNFKLSPVNRTSLRPFLNSHRIISFAYPRLLTPIESYSCKKQGEGSPLPWADGEGPRIPGRHAGIPATPIFSWVYFITRGQPGGGVYNDPSAFDTQLLTFSAHYPLLTIQFLPLRTYCVPRYFWKNLAVAL
jgi:hypothetical protein